MRDRGGQGLKICREVNESQHLTGSTCLLHQSVQHKEVAPVSKNHFTRQDAVNPIDFASTRPKKSQRPSLSPQ